MTTQPATAAVDPARVQRCSRPNGSVSCRPSSVDAALADSQQSMLYGVPMNWMTRWASPAPVVVASASGAEIEDIDGNSYVDFCLGDTGAMAGHAPAPVVEAVAERMGRGCDLHAAHRGRAVGGEEMTRRFGLAHWQFCLTATDANRFVLRLAREITGRPKIVVHNWCYHGSVDETLATLDASGDVVARLGSVGPQVDVARRPGSSRSTTSARSSRRSPTSRSPASWSSRH